MKRFTTKILSFAMVMAAFCQNIQAQTCVTITEPAALSVTASATPINCNGGTSTITAVGTGGNGTYEYNIDGGAYQASATFAGVLAATYTIGVKDAACPSATPATVSITVAQPTVVTASASAGTIACNAGTTTLTVTATGGTGAYTYSLNGAADQAMNTFSVSAGNQVVTVKDANNCSVQTAQISVSQPAVLAVTISATENSCSPNDHKVLTNGTYAMTTNVTGGTGAFTYAWTNVTSTAANPTATVTANTTYTVTVTDANLCTANATQTVTLITAPSFTLVSTNITCRGLTNGTITITASGGATPYKYSNDDGANYITPAVAAATHQFTGLGPTLYKPSVKDDNGCEVKCTN